MPRQMEPERLLRYYWYLRHSNVKKNQELAAQRIVMSHVRLGMSIVSEFAIRWPYKTDLLVAEMMWQLVNATDLMRQGAIDGHSEPNITGYLVAAVKGHLRKVGARDRILSVDPTRFKKGKHGVSVALNGYDFEYRKGEQKVVELRELVESVLSNEMEKRIVTLRVQGFDDTEIGEQLGVRKQRVWTIRNELRVKVMEKLS